MYFNQINFFLLRLHTAAKLFKCQDCGKTFSTKTDLVRHTRWSTSPDESTIFLTILHLFLFRVHTGERTFSCEDCGNTFTRKDHLVNHVRWAVSFYWSFNHSCTYNHILHVFSFQGAHRRKAFQVWNLWEIICSKRRSCPAHEVINI